MRIRMSDLIPGRLLLPFLLALMVVFAGFGCATSSPGIYRSDFLGSSYGPRFNVRQWRIEHDFLNSKYQKTEKEDWEDGSSS